MVNVPKNIGGPNYLITAKTYLRRWFKWSRDVCIHLNYLYNKSYFHNLSKLTLFDTSLAMGTWPNNFAFQIQIQVEDSMKCI